MAIEGAGTLQLRQGTCVEFTIPSSAVGYVIGRQGQRVRELERNSGARIRFKDQQESEDKVMCLCSRGGRVMPAVFLQVVVISGSGEAVRSAEEKVKECVRRKMEDQEAQSVVVPVPHHAIGRLIGRGGANIRSVQRESGAKVRLSLSTTDQL